MESEWLLKMNIFNYSHILQNEPYVFWITGLSGAGKTTLANALIHRLRRDGLTVIMLDGDELREIFGAISQNGMHHDRSSRLKLAMKYSQLCRMLAQQNINVVIATISLFKEIHQWNRLHIPGYFEIFLKIPLQELRRRDSKGIYRRFEAGELINVAGLDLPIDEPDQPDWIVDFKKEKSVVTIVDELMSHLKRKSLYDQSN